MYAESIANYSASIGILMHYKYIKNIYIYQNHNAGI